MKTTTKNTTLAAEKNARCDYRMHTERACGQPAKMRQLGHPRCTRHFDDHADAIDLDATAVQGAAKGTTK